MKPALQERHHDYVLGPNQDERLASVAAGALLKGVTLQLDSDAPFVLRSRAVHQDYTGGVLTQAGLQYLTMRWAGPGLDYRQQGMVPVRIEMPNFGQMGNPKPVFPPTVFPASSVITVDLQNNGLSAITNLKLFFRGVKLFPWGAVPAYTYPGRMASLWFTYAQQIIGLGPTERRDDILFTVKQDADFVIRGAQATVPYVVDPGTGNVLATNVSIRLKDFNKKPYSNDFMPLDVVFGSGNFPATIPIGPTPTFLSPFGPGPALPGLFYPELYVPANHQMLFDILRADSGPAQDLTIAWLGSKVFPR